MSDVFDLDSPKVLWDGALWHWAYFGGDMAVIVALLREGVPLPPEQAATLADVLEGRIRPRTPRGGPSTARQSAKRRRDDALRLMFPIMLAEVRAELGGRRRGVDSRREAFARLAAIVSADPPLPRRMTTEQVRRVIESRPAPSRWQPWAELVEPTGNTPKNSG